MKVCKNCGQSVQDIESFCPRCGSREFISGGQGGQRPPQRAPYNPQNDGGAQPSQARTPQMAPPGYRHPNARPNTFSGSATHGRAPGAADETSSGTATHGRTPGSAYE